MSKLPSKPKRGCTGANLHIVVVYGQYCLIQVTTNHMEEISVGVNSIDVVKVGKDQICIVVCKEKKWSAFMNTCMYIFEIYRKSAYEALHIFKHSLSEHYQCELTWGRSFSFQLPASLHKKKEHSD